MKQLANKCIIFELTASIFIEVGLWYTHNPSVSTFNLVLTIVLAGLLISKILKFHLPLPNFIEPYLLTTSNLYFLTLLFSSLNIIKHRNVAGFILYLVLLFSINIPVIFSVGQLTSLWARLGYILLITFISLAIPPVTYYGMNSAENTIFNLANGFSMLLLLALSLKSWNYTWKPNLPIDKNKPYQIFSGLIILFYMLWFPFFNSLIRAALTWAEVFGNWRYAFDQLNFKLIYLGYALSTGLIEEGFRYGFILLLLSHFKTRPLAKAIIVSSVTFALLHFNNLFVGWDFMSAAYQVVGAFGISLAIVAIYLYTGKLYLAITMHTLIDLMGYMLYITPNLFSTYEGFLGNFSIIMLKLLVSILFFIFFMTGKRLQVIKQNVKEMIALKN